MTDDLVRCDACPVLCRIREGRAGACDRYANYGGELVRLDPLLVAQRTVDHDGAMVPFLQDAKDWDGALIKGAESFVTGVGSTTTYPDYKPAPFIVASKPGDVDMVTVVSAVSYTHLTLPTIYSV